MMPWLPYSALICAGVLCLMTSTVGARELATNVGKTGMISIPGGTYPRADNKMVRVGPFSLLNTEITWSQFKAVVDWGAKNGFQFDGGIGQADLPAQNITWYDAVKWCNALSEMAHRPPAYFTDAALKTPYRSGKIDLTNDCVDWKASGYRLPTEAEWEYAYRAGTNTHFYWGDFPRSTPINHEYAVFHEWGTDEIDGGPIRVGSKKPNAFDLFDMAGNVEEWVWDRYAIDYAGVGESAPKGPDVGPLRVLRGGGFVIDRLFGAADRHPTYPSFVNCDNGFRIASSDSGATVELLTELPILPLSSGDVKPFSDPQPIRDIRPDTDEAAAQRLFPMLDLSAPALQKAAAAYKEQRYNDALIALRDVYVERLQHSTMNPFQPALFDLKVADNMVAIFKQNRPFNWVGPQTDNSKLMIGVTSDFGVKPDLARAFLKTGNSEYRDAYFWMLNDSSLRAKPSWDALTKVERGSAGIPRDNYMAYIGFDAGHPLDALKEISWMLRQIPQGQTCEVPPRVLANALYSAVVDRLAAGLQDDRGNVPNQVWGNALTILACSKVLPEFKDAPFWREEGIHRIRSSAGTVMADGTDLEASLNYNAFLIPLVDGELNEAFKDMPTPDWLKEINKRVEYRRYMYAALVSPLGSYPSIGNQADEKDRPRAALKGWLEAGKLAGLENNVNSFLSEKPDPAQAPAFNSAALPYGGYYVLRSGWRPDDLYCFMRSSRDGVGHGRPDNNSLQVIAYGAYLLIHGGDANYGRPSFMPAYQRTIVPYFGETEVSSVFNSNNVSVDGLLQGAPTKRVLQPTVSWDTPRDLRFYTSNNFDLMEGRFDGAYVSEKPVSDKVIRDMVTDYGVDEMANVIAYNTRLKLTPPREIKASHQRLVFFLRQEKMWIVVDLADGGSQYTQTWHFPPPSEGLNNKSFICPGFDPNQVRFDRDQKRIVTISHYRPNLAILNFSRSPIDYSKHFGDMFPFKGWYSFGISGDRVPAVTVEGTWSGSAPMVSVLVPSPARSDNAKSLDAGLTNFASLSSDTISGFSSDQANEKLIFRTSREPQSLSAFSVDATARCLLAREKADGSIDGIVLDCDGMKVDGKDQKPEGRHFHFAVEHGRFRIVAPVKSPKSFEWKRDDQGRLAPAYD